VIIKPTKNRAAWVLALLLPLLFTACDDLLTPEPIDPDFGTNRFDSRERETALGNMVCDAMVWRVNETMEDVADVDFGVINGGVFEFGLRKGAITANMISGMLKEDILTVTTLTGGQVLELFTWLAALPLGVNRWAQVSEEVQVTIDWTNGTGQLSALKIKGVDVDPGATYRLCTGDPLVFGKETSPENPVYPILFDNKANAHITPTSVADAVKDYVASRAQPYVPEIDGRLTVEK
jgi:5'-nucleotidase/UDP-sugar diphosphatase